MCNKLTPEQVRNRDRIAVVCCAIAAFNKVWSNAISVDLKETLITKMRNGLNVCRIPVGNICDFAYEITYASESNKEETLLLRPEFIGADHAVARNFERWRKEVIRCFPGGEKPDWVKINKRTNART